MIRTPGMWFFDRATEWLDQRFGYGPEPTTLSCGCTRDAVIVIGCLRCDHATCEQHHAPHDCTPEGVSR